MKYNNLKIENKKNNFYKHDSKCFHANLYHLQ